MTDTLDAMTDAQLDELIARATATKRANAQQREAEEWVRFTGANANYEARVNRRSGVVQGRYCDTSQWNRWALTSPIVEAACQSHNVLGTLKTTAAAFNALVAAGGFLK